MRVRTLLALILLAGPVLAEPVVPPPLALKYDAYFGPLRVLALESRSSQAQGRFTMSTHVQTVGLIGTLFPWDLRVEANGLAGDAVRSQRRRVESVYRSKRQTMVLEYGADGSAHVHFDPAPDADIQPVSQELRRDTFDPDAAMLGMMRVVGAGGGCSGTLRIFDGRLRYDLELHDGGTVHLAAGEGAIYSGDTRVCEAIVEPLAGFPPAERVQGQERARLRYYLAPVLRDVPLIPARVDLSGPRGTLKGYLVEAKVAAP